MKGNMKTGKYRTADGKAQIEWELTQKENGLEFSASGDYDGGCGQCIDEIAKAYPQDETVQRIAKIWREWHLNGMNSGLPDQDKAIKDRLREYPDDYKNAPYNGDRYDWACGYLKSIGLYEIPLPLGVQATGGFPLEVVNGERGYRYGERWVYRPIPDWVIAEIESWPSKPLKSLHVDRAQDFLARNGIKFRATLSDSKVAPWEPEAGMDTGVFCGAMPKAKPRHHYRVTLSSNHVTGPNHARRLTFDFWGSIADAEKGITEVSAYDVLACISGDVNAPETFEDYCAEYGENQDSIKAKQTFTRLSRFAKRLRAFFTETELEQLQEIQ